MGLVVAQKNAGESDVAAGAFGPYGAKAYLGQVTGPRHSGSARNIHQHVNRSLGYLPGDRHGDSDAADVAAGDIRPGVVYGQDGRVEDQAKLGHIEIGDLGHVHPDGQSLSRLHGIRGPKADNDHTLLSAE